MASELEPCPFCSKTMMLRSALWPSEGDADAIIHADPTDCPMLGFSDGSADGSIIEKWNCSLSNEDDFPSDGSCVRCGSVPRNANGLCNTCLDEDAERLENTRTTPVAPVSPDTDGKCGELVTVGYMVSHEEGLGIVEEPVCYRSQAEELLAAERAEKDGWKELHDAAQVAVKERTEACNNLYKQVNDLKADNAAKDARINFLERVTKDQETQITAQEVLEAKLASAEKALEAARPYVEDYDTRRHNTGVDETLTQIDAVLGGKPS
ncbi:hypothetical protein N7376_15790 [Brucella intermedia GD04153]|uniref:Uncharacterized protein n=1 Tax=Brucella intermedia GD04153 TaxID=2975438 RepID=A0AA42KT45_9HYPH|nr:hypothetical protein [Brucella intermedia]MDH0125470.1 hypothetical protein [Brucella intermedia GD04153]